MKAWRGGAKLLLALTAIAAAPPDDGLAKSGYEVRPGGFATEIQIRGGNGWDVSVSALRHGRVAVTTSKGPMAATYTAPGRATRHGIWANLGSLGRIALRFEPTAGRKVKRMGSRCTGRPAITENGTFRGTLRFRGERGYTAANVRSAFGTVSRWHRTVCKRRSQRLSPGPPGRISARSKRFQVQFSVLLAGARRHGHQTVMLLMQADGVGGTASREFDFTVGVAGRSERRGRVAISRRLIVLSEEIAVLTGKPGAFPMEATVAPAKPFSGTATYFQERGQKASWSGDLGVWLPGAETVRLTGPGFESSLCVVASERRLAACLRRLAGSFLDPAPEGSRQLLRQISGSQSQLFGDARLSWVR